MSYQSAYDTRSSGNSSKAAGKDTLQFDGRGNDKPAKWASSPLGGGWGSGGSGGSGAAGASGGKKRKKGLSSGMTRFAAEGGVQCAAARSTHFDNLLKTYMQSIKDQTAHFNKMQELQLETLSMRQQAQAAQLESMPAEDFAGSLSHEMDLSFRRLSASRQAAIDILSCWPLPLHWCNVDVTGESD